jgi:hypothetical protein
MSDVSFPSLTCNDCGHTWKTRSGSPKSPQCSKCRSRDVSEVGDGAESSNTTRMDIVRAAQAQKKIPTGFHPMPQVIADDPEIISKLKELELARLERLLAEEKEVDYNPDVLQRVVHDFKDLLFVLYCNKHLTKEQYKSIVDQCPWCTSCSMELEEFSDGESGWKCHYCGKEVV